MRKLDTSFKRIISSISQHWHVKLKEKTNKLGLGFLIVRCVILPESI